jgi:hypothetical protein
MRANRSALSITLALALVSATAVPSAAQVPGGGGGGPGAAQQQSGGAIGRLTPEQQLSRFESEEQRRRLSMSPEEAEAEYGVERMELARRVLALVEEGRCSEARAMANDAGERQMALRIRRTCRQGVATPPQEGAGS